MKTTATSLRALATFVALLLTVSALGQVAHFLLVTHAICAEHGELVDVARDSTVAPEPGAAKQPRAQSSEAPGAHDHCQVLARHGREQALLPEPAFALQSASHTAAAATLPARGAAEVPCAPLAVAPKTSPPAILAA